jgi:REP element-mobilizing transposase RayT
LHWVFEAKKRLGLSVLNYTVTSNHIHLLVRDTGGQVIAQSMQLIAGRTAQEYNQRKGRQGSILGRPLPCHRDRGGRASASVRCLHRLEHGSHRRSQAPV